MKLIYGIMLSALFSGTALGQKIDWFASADFVGVKNQEESYEQDTYLREFELALFSKVDQNWSSALSLIMERAAGAEDSTTHLHEAYIQSSNIIAGDTIRIGQFFLGVGKLNRIHRHEWAFTTAPFFFEEFFNDEGVVDTGVEYIARIGTALNLQLTAGITKGAEFSHQHEEHEHENEEEHGGNAQWPTHYFRLGGFWEMTTTQGLEYGLNHLIKKDAEKTVGRYSGLDITYKKRVGKVLETMAIFEFWQRTRKFESVDELSDSGYYLHIDKGLNQHHSIGLGTSYYIPDHDLPESMHKHEGRATHDHYQNYYVNYTYSNSEFVKYRFTLEQENGLIIDEVEDETNYRYQVQLLFNIGKHPVHLF